MKLPSDEQRKFGFYVAAGAFAVLAAIAAFCRPEGAWPLVALAIASAVAANIDRMRGLRASGAGIELEWTMRAEAAVTEMTEVANRLGNLENGLEAKTKDLVGHITGGESYPLVKFVPSAAGAPLALIVEVVGKYSLRDVSARMVDAAEDNPRAAVGVPVDFGFIAARTLRHIPGALFDEVRRQDEGRIDIFFSAFNGVMTQFLDYRKTDGRWHFASCLLAHGRAFKHIDADFGPQPSDWDAERVRLSIELENEPSGKIS